MINASGDLVDSKWIDRLIAKIWINRLGSSPVINDAGRCNGRCIIAGNVLDCIGIIAGTGICVGNGGRLPRLDGAVQNKFNGGAVDGDPVDRCSTASNGDLEIGCCCCCIREFFAECENDFGAVTIGSGAEEARQGAVFKSTDIWSGG